MLLFEHKQHYQSYNAQSSKQRKIYAFKEKDYNKELVELHELPSGLVTLPTPKCTQASPSGTQSMLRRGRLVV